MDDRTRNVIIVVIAIGLALFLALNPPSLYGALPTLRDLGAIVFYVLGSIYLYRLIFTRK